MSVRAPNEESSSEALGAAGGGAWVAKTRWNGWLRRRLARAPEAAAGILWGAELYMTARRARRRHGIRARALPRGYFDHAAERMAAREAVAVGSESLVAAGAAAAAMGWVGAMGVGAMAAAVLGAAEMGEGMMGVEETVEVEMEAAATAAGATAARAAATGAASEGRWASAPPRSERSRRG